MSQEKTESDRMVKKMQIEVLSLAEGFFQSSILFALLKLKIFELVDDGSKTLHELAEELDAQPATLSRLLNAGVVLKLLESKDGINYSIAPACRAVLSPSAGEQYLGDWIRSLDYFCEPLSKLDKAVLNSAPTTDPAVHLGGQGEYPEFCPFDAQLCVIAWKAIGRLPWHRGMRIVARSWLRTGDVCFSSGQTQP